MTDNAQQDADRPADAFAENWLSLRAAADARARNIGLLGTLVERFAGAETLRVLDLGAGTGNNMRALASQLPGRQTWRLADADAGLLSRVMPIEGVTIETITVDLAEGLAPLLDWRPDLVTASALIDLAGADWLDGVADALAQHELPVYFALSYTGRETWSPPNALDARVAAVFEADMGRDKGLGPSLGPAAHAHFADALRKRGFTVHAAASDWRLEALRDGPLIAELATGTARAVRPALGPPADEWLAARRGASAVLVSHSDLLGIPPA
ncbi:MAG: SAM-dependent methyltransferase [Pseudomonadota bacterium]